MAQKGLWNVAREKMLQDGGALPKEEGDIVSEYKGMHEDNFLKGKEEGRTGRNRLERRKAEVVNERGREEEKTVVVRRRCVNPFSGDVLMWPRG